mgnify:FL=1
MQKNIKTAPGCNLTFRKNCLDKWVHLKGLRHQSLGVLRRHAPADHEPSGRPLEGTAPRPVETAAQGQSGLDPNCQDRRSAASKGDRLLIAGRPSRTLSIIFLSKNPAAVLSNCRTLPHIKTSSKTGSSDGYVDTNYGFVLATEMTPASHHDSPYLPLCVARSGHTKTPIKKVYADKGYFGKNNREFLHMNNIADGIMTKASRGTELTPFEKERNKAISKIRYKVEQYFGLSHLHNNAFRARFTRLIKNAIDALFRQMAFNLLRGTKVLTA